MANSFCNLYEFGQAWWAEARKKVKKAVVYLDPVACECLHWNGGAPSILEAGAHSIKELSSFEIVPKSVKKGVFISSSAWHGTNYKILENLIRNSNLEYCVLITTSHVAVHSLLQWGHSREGGNEHEAFDNIEKDVLNWMGNLNYTVEILSYPLMTLHPTMETVLIPSAKLADPFIPSDIGYLNEQLMLFGPKMEAQALRSLNDLTFMSLPLESQAQARQLVYHLNQLLQHLNAKDEIYTVGCYSRIIGTELEALNLAKSRRKVATNKVSVIIIDRSLDLTSVTKCSSETLYDKLSNSLDRLHEMSSDVSINLTATNSKEDVTAVSGCLAPQTDFNNSWRTMEHLLYEGSEEAINFFEKEFQAALDNPNSDYSLTDLTTDCDNNWDFIENFPHLYQIGKAIAQDSKCFTNSKMKILEEIQQSLIKSIQNDSSSPLMQILQLLKTMKDLNITLDDIFLLLLHLYSLVGDQREKIFSLDMENRLKSLIAEIIVDDYSNLSERVQDFVGVPVDEVRAHRASQKVFEQLHFISEARSYLKKYRSVYSRENPAMPFEYKPFIQQLFEDIFDPSILDNPDLEHKSGSLKELFKTGFSLFVNVRKPKPSDNPLIMLYVCGGIRPDEVKFIRDLFLRKSPNHNVVVISSHFISVYDSLHYILKKNVRA